VEWVVHLELEAQEEHLPVCHHIFKVFCKVS